MGWIKDHIKEILWGVLGSALTTVGAYLAGAARLHCSILRINSIYCTDDFIRWQVFLFVGFVIGVLFWKRFKVVGVVALILFVAPFAHHAFNLRDQPKELFEFGLVVPQQLAIGMLLGLAVTWLVILFRRQIFQRLRKSIAGSGTTTPTP